MIWPRFLPLVGVLMTFWSTADACGCIPQSQQAVWCQSKWISRARITAKNNLGANIEYTVNHLDIFKNHTGLMPNNVYTPSNSASCGLTNLEVGKEYLLTGTTNGNTNALSVNSCFYMPAVDNQGGFTLPWQKVPGVLKNKLQTNTFAPCPPRG